MGVAVRPLLFTPHYLSDLWRRGYDA